MQKILFFLISSLIFASYPTIGFAIPSPATNAPHTKTEPKAQHGDPKSLELNEKGVAAVNAHDFAAAEELFKQAVTIDKGNITAVFNLAGMYLTNKKEDQAISLLNDYTKIVPNDPGIWVRLGDAYFSTKRPQEAVKQYEKALALAPKYERLCAKLGTIYGLLKKIPEAVKAYECALKEQPKDAQLLANLSALYLADKKLAQSVNTAKRALQVKPTSEVYITLGNAYEMQSDYKNAAIAFERALDLGNTSEDLKKKIEELKHQG